MSRTVRIHQVDAFTLERFTGNPAGVVLGAEHLDDASMLAIARELNNGDTAFVLPPDADDHDVRVRFFTPRTEAAFVGHATVAAQFVLSAAAGAATTLRQKTRAGVAQIHVQGAGAERRIAIRQAAPPLGRELADAERDAVLDALGLPAAQLDPRCPLRIAGGGSTRLLIGLWEGAQLAQLQPDLSRLGVLSGQLGAAGYFVFSLAPALPGYETESRMFCPALGIPEDPVSGNAHGMLGVYLGGLGLLPVTDGRLRFTGAQGHHMRRPGRVGIEIEFVGGAAAAVWITGQAVSVFETQIEI